MECRVKWIEGGMSFVAETGSNHALMMDGPPDAGGRNLAPRPMELLLAGAGGCTAFDVVMILQKSRQAITGCEVSLQADRAESDPKVFTRIHFHFRVSGRSLKREAVERASQGPGQVGPEHVEAAMREVDHAHDAEDQRQARRQQEQQQPVLNRVQALHQKSRKIHGSPESVVVSMRRKMQVARQHPKLVRACSRAPDRPAPWPPRRCCGSPCRRPRAGRCPAPGCAPG